MDRKGILSQLKTKGDVFMEDNPAMNLLSDNDNNGNMDGYNCSNMTVGMAYVPIQEWNRTYGVNEALSRGTQFPELDKPFFGEDMWK